MNTEKKKTSFEGMIQAMDLALEKKVIHVFLFVEAKT